MTEEMMKKIAIEFNNVGCLFLDRGCHNEAMPFIEKGIKVVARSISENPLQSQEELEDALRNIHACAISCRTDTSTSKNDKNDQQAGPSICRQSFPISQPMHKEISDHCHDFGDDDDDSTVPMDYIASRLLYHRALAMHLKAIEEGKVLFGVLQQYACAKDLIVGNIHIEEEAFTIALAILNNEAQCHYEMFEFDLSHEIFEELCSMLDYHCTFHEGSPDGGIESLCSLNCVIYKEPPSTARAA
jgi:hypothetical protein